VKQLLVALLLLVSLGSGADEKVYHWKDSAGRVHYGGQPPSDGSRAREVEVHIPSHAGEAEVSTVSAVGRGVTIYTTATCGYCKAAKAYLRKRSIPFVEHDVERSITGKLDFKRLNGRAVPVILVGNQRMNGFSERRLAAMLSKAGY